MACAVGFVDVAFVFSENPGKLSNHAELLLLYLTENLIVKNKKFYV